MFHNYVITALRNLARNALYTGINVKLNFPSIDKVARLEPGLRLLRHGDVEYVGQTAYFADPEFFEVLQLPALWSANFRGRM